MALIKFDMYGNQSNDCLTLRKSKYLFIPKKIAIEAGYSAELRYVTIFVDDTTKEVSIKFELEEAPGRKIMVEKSGISLNLIPVLSYLGYKNLYNKVSLPVKFVNGLLMFCLKEIPIK